MITPFRTGRPKCLEGRRGGRLVGEQEQDPQGDHDQPPGSDRVWRPPEGGCHREHQKGLQQPPGESRQPGADLANGGQEEPDGRPCVDDDVIPLERRHKRHRPQDNPHRHQSRVPLEAKPDSPLQDSEHEPDSSHHRADPPDAEAEQHAARHQADQRRPEHPAADQFPGRAGRCRATCRSGQPVKQTRLRLLSHRGGVGKVVVLEPGRLGVGIVSASAAPRGSEERGGHASHQDVAEQGVTVHVSSPFGAKAPLNASENGPTC